MARIHWKENKILSIETRKGVFVLAQMIKAPYIIFFNSFTEEGKKFKDDVLENTPVLFTHAVTRQFLRKSNIETVKHIKPLENYQPPKLWIKEDASSRKVTAWKGTENEKEFITFGENGATLIEKDILKDYETNKSSPGKSIKHLDSKNTNINDILEYELTSVEVYPNLNERLFLCYLTEKNVDPAKNILFNLEMPLEYKKYVDIVSGTIKLEKLGY